jgi:hypothetical protein
MFLNNYLKIDNMSNRYFAWIFFLMVVSSCQKDTIVGSNDYKTLGTSAHDLLSASRYQLLQVEINYMPGYAPDTATINALQNFLSALINKPAGIQIIPHQIAGSGKSVCTLNDIVGWEKTNRTLFTGNDVIAVHILITDNGYTDVNTFGKSYWNTSICLFGKTINNRSGGIGQVSKAKLFTIIAEHELGHLIGLVNEGSPMQVDHKDAANGAHCSNTACLMYYAIETAIPSGILGIGPALDVNCITDLKANGGK